MKIQGPNGYKSSQSRSMAYRIPKGLTNPSNLPSMKPCLASDDFPSDAECDGAHTPTKWNEHWCNKSIEFPVVNSVVDDAYSCGVSFVSCSEY